MHSPLGHFAIDTDYLDGSICAVGQEIDHVV
ncbi:MAG: hypothetical protein ACJARU_000827 [Congregibacter sp.]|jgi:hypothetical protein